MWKERMNRRGFLSGILRSGLLAVFGLPLLARAQGDPPLPNVDAPQPNTLSLDLELPEYAALKTPGGAVYVEHKKGEKPLIVWRQSEDSLKAFSSRCTHKGCKLDLPAADQMLCPCHKAVFNAGGEPTAGPAKDRLPEYPAELTENAVVIQLG